MRRVAFAVLCAGLTAALPEPSPAQGIARGAILGRVTDGAGTPIVGAQIVAAQGGGGYLRRADTNAEGRYQIFDVILGPYEITASHTDYWTRTEGALVRFGQIVEVDFVLDPR